MVTGHRAVIVLMGRCGALGGMEIGRVRVMPSAHRTGAAAALRGARER